MHIFTDTRVASEQKRPGPMPLAVPSEWVDLSKHCITAICVCIVSAPQRHNDRDWRKGGNEMGNGKTKSGKLNFGGGSSELTDAQMDVISQALDGKVRK